IRPFKLEIESRQQDVRLDVIGHDLDDLLEQFDGLFRLSLRLQELSQLKNRSRIVRSELQRASQERLRFFQLPVLTIEPAESDVCVEIMRVEFQLLFELLSRRLAGAGEQVRHAELRMRGRQFRIEPRGLLQLFNRRLKLAARQIK